MTRAAPAVNTLRPEDLIGGALRRTALGLAALTLLVSCGVHTSGGDSTAEPAPRHWIAGSTEEVDAHGTRWSPDPAIASGGSLESSTAAVGGTNNPVVYQHSRVGVTSYRLPVARTGRYAVVLYLADLDGVRAGQRVFDVLVNGRPAASGIDVVARVGTHHADRVLLTTTAKRGHLTVSFRARAGVAAINAVTMSWVDAGTAPETVFTDDFTGPAGSALDSRWSSEVGGNGWGNNELQSYTARTSNASLTGTGDLAITARRETFTGADGITRAFTSAKVTTEKSVDLRYGRVAARIRMPAGSGLLPAFWMLGRNHASAGWPQSGEMDIAERPVADRGIFGSLHGPLTASPRTAYNLTNKTTLSTSPAAGFHVYAIDWYPGVVKFSVDGRAYATETATDLAPGQNWVFDQPFYLLLNVAVGGNWPGSPPADEAFPQQMLVDYVRVTR
ncbi:MAG: family 16 glycosylhydrolase [Frankia sp.]